MCSILPSQLLVTIHLAVSHVVPLSFMWLFQNGHSFPFSVYFEVWFLYVWMGGFGAVWFVWVVFGWFFVCVLGLVFLILLFA